MIKNNREFLLIYDASLCNPNGDSDDNNMPRMDYVRQINLVSDVRVKRDSREVLKHNGEKIFVDLLDGKKVTNENMLMNYLEENNIYHLKIRSFLKKTLILDIKKTKCLAI